MATTNPSTNATNPGPSTNVQIAQLKTAHLQIIVKIIIS